MEERQRTRVLIVDDDVYARAILRYILGQDPRLQVVGEATDAQSARVLIKQHNPDVVTLDVEMPGMDGLAFLRVLMRAWPLPVVMVSSFTPEGSDLAVQALSMGAVDCIGKSEVSRDVDPRQISDRVLGAARAKVKRHERRDRSADGLKRRETFGKDMPLVLVGASTGGVNALERVISGLAAKGPPLVIVQHMPHVFLKSLAARLDRLYPQRVRLAKVGRRLTWGDIAIAPAVGHHTAIRRTQWTWECDIASGTQSDRHCPSVDALFRSAVPHAPDVIAVLLTGLGRDGAEGMKELYDGGAFTIAQDEATSVVYGMPRVAVELGGVRLQCPLSQIGQQINARAEVIHHSRKVTM